MWLDLIRLVGGMLVLIYAAERLVRSAVTISRAFEVSAVLIGAIVIGFGTSVPEFVVSGLAGVEGELDLAVSNVVSSNIANVTLVLGTAAVVSALAASRRVIRREGLLMLGAVMALALVLIEGRLLVVEGFLMIALLGGAVYLMVRWATDDPSSVATAVEEYEPPVDLTDREGMGDAQWRRLVGREIIVGVVALIATVAAAQFMLEGLLGIGERLDFSVVFLGFIAGVGTSLPELAASVAAARHRQSELALGNVLGSNVFNSLGVIGFAALLSPGTLEEVTPAFLGVMVASAIVAGVFAYTGRHIQRTEGVLLLVAFAAYAVLAYS